MKSALLAAVLLQGCLATPVANQQQQLIFAAPSVASAVLSSLSVPSLESLASTLPSDHFSQLAEHVASLPERRTVALLDSDGRLVELDITEGDKALLVYAGIKFDDVTETIAMPADPAFASWMSPLKEDDDASFPSKWHYGKDKLQKLLYSHIDKDRMLQRLKKFTSFRTRYYRSNDGKQSQKWLLETVRSVAASAPKLNIDVKEFPHQWGQNSIIAHLPIGNRSQTSKGKVIIGAHQDSTNLLPFLSAPGADDDASGSITVLEVLSIIAEATWQPENYDVEFHWYSAEEGGMLGSNAIAADYAAKMRQGDAEDSVRAMLQMDMTAYIKPGTEERIGIIEDFVNPELTKYVKDLTGEYTGIPSVDTKCGYACSDHSSWTKIGVPSAFAIEATFEDSNTGAIHSSRDTIDLEGYSLDHVTRFVRLSAAFAVELST